MCARKACFLSSVLLFLVFMQGCVSVKSEMLYSAINEKSAANYVGFLSSDMLEGREAGSRGGAIAAGYIVSLLKEWNVEPLLSAGYEQIFVAEGVEMKNILAVVPGSGEGYVVVGAHYDHLGISLAVDGDSCYNGADDNASGVSAVLQIARAVKSSGIPPERSIVFAFWDGEEKGLLGSSHFVENCPFLSSISAYMNFDMVGRGPLDEPAHLTYFYTASHPRFGQWLREDTERYDFSFIPDYRSWDNPVSGSDNAPFARAGVPVVWYHTEGHPDYHRPSDSADRINYRKLADITRAAYLCVLRLAGAEQ